MAKILVVDDSEVVRAKLVEDLTKAGHEVIQGTDGADGLAKLKSTQGVQLILCDVNMPNMDGLTMCQKVRKVEGYSETPIMMLTTEANDEMKATAKAVGVRAWINKPHVAEKLVAAIDVLLKKK